MKKSFLLPFILLLFLKNTAAQNNCNSAYPYLTGTSVSYPAETSSTAPLGPNYGCLTATSNPTWFYLGLCSDGNISIDITSATLDVDFVAWGPFSNSSTMCSTISSGSSSPFDCSFSTGLSEQFNIPNALQGEFYVLMITNFSGNPGAFTLSTNAATIGVACDSTALSNPCIAPLQPICKVTANNVSNHNLIFWDKTSSFTGFYNIQRETSTSGVYSTIASIPSSDTSVYEDITSNTMVQAYKYKIQTADTCGNINNGGGIHRTMHLQSSLNLFLGYPQLSWNPYSGFGYGTFYISRGNSPSSITLYDSIASGFTTYTDINPISGLNYYVISVIPPAPCQPSRSLNNMAFSNISIITITNITENNLENIMISPNPATDELLISFGKTVFDNSKIELIDITGRIVKIENVMNENYKKIDVGNLNQGCYFLKFTTTNSSIQKKIIISR